MSAHEVVYVNQPREMERLVTQVEGRIPDDLQGTLLRNGSGIFEHGGDLVNYVDGHGMIGALGFAAGRAVLQTRFVDTDVLREERVAGRQMRRRLFTNRPNRWDNFLDIRIANPANHDIYYWGGRVFAANDPGHYELDPVTLATKGLDRWGGVVPRGHLMSPMPRRDPRLDRLVCYTLSLGIASPSEITFREFDRGWRERKRVAYRLGRSVAAVHDLAFTERYYVAFDQPTRLDLPALLWGRGRVSDAIAWQYADTPRMMLVPREASSGVRALDLPVPPGVLAIFHFLNAFERGDEIVVDVLGSNGPPEVAFTYPRAFRERYGLPLSPPFPVGVIRYVVRPDAARIEAAPIGRIRGDMASINPAYHGRDYRYAYLLLAASDGDEPVPGTAFWAHEIARLDVETGACQSWHAGSKHFCSQPAFAARRDARTEDDGYLLSWVIDAERQQTEVVILDARALAKGPIARLHLGCLLPPTIHCRFEAELALAALS